MRARVCKHEGPRCKSSKCEVCCMKYCNHKVVVPATNTELAEVVAEGQAKQEQVLVNMPAHLKQMLGVK